MGGHERKRAKKRKEERRELLRGLEAVEKWV